MIKIGITGSFHQENKASKILSRIRPPFSADKVVKEIIKIGSLDH